MNCTHAHAPVHQASEAYKRGWVVGVYSCEDYYGAEYLSHLRQLADGETWREVIRGYDDGRSVHVWDPGCAPTCARS